MSLRSFAWTKSRILVAGSAAVILAAGGIAALVAVPGAQTAARHAAGGTQHARLAASTCSGPDGAAYVADAGWDGFTAISTANCSILQTYNVGDTTVPGDPGDYNYSSTDEGIALHGSTLYFADTGNNMVSVIDAATLNPKNYNPAETDIHVGYNPTYVAVTPDGSQLWVADTGPQTSQSSPKSITVISTATRKVTATVPLPSAPAQIAFSPSEGRAYVTTAEGLYVFSTASHHLAGVVRGLGDPHGAAVSADGKTVYVTSTEQSTVDVIDAATGRVTGRIGVGQMPWQLAIAPEGGTMYVSNPDSDSISVISTASGKVTSTISVPGDPAALGLTPDGSQLWVGGLTSAIVTVLDTSDGSAVGSINLGNDGANSGDGYRPTGIVLTATPPAGS